MNQSAPIADSQRVVIVDDDPAVLNALQFALGVEGFDVSIYSGAVALLAASVPAGSCLVLDYNLGDMNGLDLADRLRERGVAGPVILITSHPSVAVRRRAEASGIRVIEKPLMDGVLGEAIRASIVEGSVRQQTSH